MSAKPTAAEGLAEATIGAHTEDVAHQSGDTGVMTLAVRHDAGTPLAGKTGDYIPLTTDAAGALRVTGGVTVDTSLLATAAKQGVAGYTTVTPAGQASTASTVVLAGSEMDVRAKISLAYTIAVATHDVTWSVWGANASDYSDEVAVLAPVSVVLSTSSSYAVALAPYGYYRVKIIDTVGATHGTATVRGIAKA